MTTTPSSQLHSQLQLLLLLPVILVVILAAVAEGLRPGCHDKCGDISIPFPFGIGPGCFRHGFEVSCNHSYDPPRAFLVSKDIYVSWSPLELVSISVSTGELRVYAAVSYSCNTNETTSNGTVDMNLFTSPFAVSLKRNVLIGVNDDPQLCQYYFSVPGVSCLVYSDWESMRNGSCTGPGCCEAALPTNYGAAVIFILSAGSSLPTAMSRDDYKCNYGMLVEKSWYNFSTLDMSGNKTLLKRFPQGVPVALDFAAGNASCPALGQPLPPDYACISGNSSCANAANIYVPALDDTGGAMPGFSGSFGYICKCWDHYDGNPYIPNGCQDIDECKHPEVYRCSNGGICRNKLGGYDCPCEFGMKGDAKTGTCTTVFTPAAKTTVGGIGALLLMAVLLFLVILHKEKKKTKEFYKKNGGPILQKVDVIKLFKKGELKPILRSSNLIGKGGFGEVYKGLLDDKVVAIKKPINGTVLESEQFANEVIIQSRVIHKNIVRLIGCCLEVDAPMLVYEFISQGSLHDILHSNNNKVALNLDTRLNIAAQSADGLAYMHSKTNNTVLHGDVKPANILLDDNFVPKVSDFGISRLIQRDKEHTGSVIGDMNYMDPVYLQEGLLTEKSDVYSFGIVILELISSRRAIHSESNSLVKSFLEAHKKQKKTTEFFDKEIAITKDMELLDSLAGMVMECLSLDVDQRPTMMEVAERLLTLGRSRKV